MSGGGDSGSSAPANTTSQNTTTYIQDVPAYEQSYLSNLLGQASTIASQPYQQFPGQEVAGFSPDQTQAFSNVENLANNGAWQGADTAANASAAAGANTASGIYGAGAGDVNAATTYNPLAAASPYLNAAAATASPQGISSYLSPYTNDVVGGLVNTANQNWNNNIMPGVDDAFIGTGQFASGRNAQVIGQAANTFEQNLEGSVSNALETGYNTAGNQAATEAGVLGNAANTAASATGAQASNLLSAGNTLGNLAATQAGAQGAAATNVANTAQTGLNTGVTAASALQDVGQAQQNLSQQSINQAMTDFQNQTMFPQQEAGFLSNIIHGLPAMGTSGTLAGQQPATTNQVGSTSPLSTLGATIIGASGLNASGAKKGGLIKGYAEGGKVEGDAMDDVISRLLDPGPDDIKLDTSGADNMPPPTQAALPAPSTSDIPDNLDPDTAPISAAVQGSRLVPADNEGSPLKMASPMQPSSSPDETRNLQLLAMARGMLKPAHSGAESLGNALGGYVDVGLNAPKYQGEQIANQMSTLGLQRMQAMQPGLISEISGMNSGSNSPAPSTGGSAAASPVDAQFAQAYHLALTKGYATGDFSEAAKVMQSWAEHNPKLAGAVKSEQEAQTPQKMPDGTFKLGAGLFGSQAAPAVSSSTATAPADSSSTMEMPTAMDGKPLLPGVKSVGIDQSGTPKYNTDNTETGVNQTKLFQAADDKANDEMTTNLSNVSKEQYRLKQLSDVYKQTQSGTLLAQNPDVANQLVAWGVIKDPAQIHDLALVQKGIANQAIQIIQMTKDANANIGAAPARLFGSEITNMQKKAENLGSQPEANYEVLTDAMGLANHMSDMAKGWDSIGGLGNRAANGYTLRPSVYTRQFIESHDIQDYKEKAKKDLGPFKGMAGAATGTPPGVTHVWKPGAGVTPLSAQQ